MARILEENEVGLCVKITQLQFRVKKKKQIRYLLNFKILNVIQSQVCVTLTIDPGLTPHKILRIPSPCFPRTFQPSLQASGIAFTSGIYFLFIYIKYTSTDQTTSTGRP